MTKHTLLKLAFTALEQDLQYLQGYCDLAAKTDC